MVFVFAIVFLFIIRCRFPKTKSLAEVIRSRYGSHILKSTRKYEKLDYRIRKVTLDIAFLNTCLENNVTPTFLKFRLSSFRLQNSRAYKDCQRKLLRDEIAFKVTQLAKLNQELNVLGDDLKSSISYFDLTHVINIATKSNIDAINKVESIQNYKLSELIGEHMSHDSNDVIKNYSSHNLSTTEKNLLMKGLNFALPPKKLKYENYLLPFELLYREVLLNHENDNTLIHLKSRIRDVGLSSFSVYNKKDHRFENLNKEEYAAFLNLSSNNSIIIQKADKGNTVVILDKIDYIKEMEELLSDTSKFQSITFNPKHKVNKEVRHLVDMENTIKACLDDLLQKQYLSADDHKFMTPCGSRPGIMYGLCKVHKERKNGKKTPPFRPILSAIGTCSYNMAKFFVPILKPVSINQYTVNDSFSFADEIRMQDSNLYMTSFDVKSLFTNIPLDETISICVDKLYHRKKKVKGMLKRHCMELLTLATKSSCFLFNNTYYTQIDGVAMGSPLGPTLANVFLSHHEETWLEKCPSHFKPVYYRRYVDDVIVLFKSKDHVKMFLRYLNSRHKNIEFTYEEEDDNSLTFLDVLISRKDNRFETSVYKKKTFSGVYVNFKSFLPMDYKHGLLFTLLFRAYKLSSNYSKLHEEIVKLKTIWQKNRYPLFIIDKCIKKFLNNLFIPKPAEEETNNNKVVTISLQYLGKASLEVRKRLRNAFRSYCPDIKLRVVFNSSNRLKNAFLYKDLIMKELNSRVLYKFSCGICKNSYVGKTKRHFIVRRHEHLGISISTNDKFSYNENSATAIRKHIHECQHECTANDFSIIGSAMNNYHLLLKESIVISLLKPSLNNAKESIPLHLF